MPDIEHTTVYVCPVHGETQSVVMTKVPFCVKGDCARNVEVVEMVRLRAADYRGAVEALQIVAREAIRDPVPHSSAWLIPAGAMDLVRASLNRAREQ